MTVISAQIDLSLFPALFVVCDFRTMANISPRAAIERLKSMTPHQDRKLGMFLFFDLLPTALTSKTACFRTNLPQNLEIYTSGVCVLVTMGDTLRQVLRTSKSGLGSLSCDVFSC
jgi:hypothetical protein